MVASPPPLSILRYRITERHCRSCYWDRSIRLWRNVASDGSASGSKTKMGSESEEMVHGVDRELPLPSVYRQANNINMLKDGMKIEATHVKKKQLHQYLPPEVLQKKKKVGGRSRKHRLPELTAFFRCPPRAVMLHINVPLRHLPRFRV